MAHLTPRHPTSAHSSPQPRGLLSFMRSGGHSPHLPLLPGHQRRGSHGHGGVHRSFMQHPRICLRCGPRQAWIVGATICAMLMLYLFLMPPSTTRPHTPLPAHVVPTETPAVRQLAQMRMQPPSHVLLHASDDPGIADEFTPADATFRLQRIPLLAPSAAFPLDSTAETLMLRPLQNQANGNGAYHICTFTNVCATPEGLQFRFQNHTAWMEFAELSKRCEDQTFYWSQRICHCFHYAFKPLVLPYEFYNPVVMPIAQQRAADSLANAAAARQKDKAPVVVDSFARKYPDPFLHVRAARYSHAWSIHKWVSHHHIAHWSQKLMMFQSIMQHASLFHGLLPPLSALVFHDTSNTHPKLEDHLLNIFNLTIEAAVGWTKEAPSPSTDAGEGGRTVYEWAHPQLWSGDDASEQLESLLDPSSGRVLWTEDLLEQRYTTSLPPNTCAQLDNCRVKNPVWKLAAAAKTPASREDGSYETIYDATTGQPIPERVADPSLHTCFARLSLSPTYGLLSQDAADVDRFRAVTGARMSLPASLDSVCPPRRAVLLTRLDRRILNVAELDAYMLSRHGLTLEHHLITERNSSLEQVALFAETGLILSSHSSQLINVLFSHPSQAIVEISAEFYNVDFAAYAHAVGLWFHYALGGSIPRDATEDPRQDLGYTFVDDPLMTECVRALQSSCPTGDSHCLMRVSPLVTHCGRVSQWPNKQMNFVANLTAIDVAVSLAIEYIEGKCEGKW